MQLEDAQSKLPLIGAPLSACLCSAHLLLQRQRRVKVHVVAHALGLAAVHGRVAAKALLKLAPRQQVHPHHLVVRLRKLTPPGQSSSNKSSGCSHHSSCTHVLRFGAASWRHLAAKAAKARAAECPVDLTCSLYSTPCSAHQLIQLQPKSMAACVIRTQHKPHAGQPLT